MIQGIKQGRITLYANSGRVSIKRIIRIVNDHIDSRNRLRAIMAVNELKIAVNDQYCKYEYIINEMLEKIKKI